jgi:hypothetical protein
MLIAYHQNRPGFPLALSLDGGPAEPRDVPVIHLLSYRLSPSGPRSRASRVLTRFVCLRRLAVPPPRFYDREAVGSAPHGNGVCLGLGWDLPQLPKCLLLHPRLANVAWRKRPHRVL